MRIILADHHAQPLWGLKLLLEENSDFDLIGEAENTQSLLELVEKYPVDLILVDCELPGIYIEDLITSIHAIAPMATIITMSSDYENSRKMLKAGADAFVSKGEQADWLLEILRKYEKQTRVGNAK